MRRALALTLGLAAAAGCGGSHAAADVARRLGLGPGDRGFAMAQADSALSLHQTFGLLLAGGTVVFGQDIDPDAAIAALDEVTHDDVVAVAREISESLSVAVVGPHSQNEFV